MAERYVYTDLSLPFAVSLTINGIPYEVVQYASSWAVNEIPTAVCMLAIGRNARSQQLATVNTQDLAVQMQPAVVYFQPDKEYSPNDDWPALAQVIFSGFFTGFAYRKINGKVYAIANLIHWLASLGMSSALTKNGHVSNPTSFNAAAVLQSLGQTNAKPVYISNMVPGVVLASTVTTDLWAGIKEVFCRMADISTMPVGPAGSCAGAGTYSKNDVAKDALNQMEGPAASCNVPYHWGVPLHLDTLQINVAEEKIADAIGTQLIASYSTTTFWDKLVGEFCPMFGMAVVPMVESAIVIADTPALSGTHWREIDPTEYDSFDMSAELFRPLRGVGVMATYDTPTVGGVEAHGQRFDSVGGCYVEDSVKPGDGVIQYISPPVWLDARRIDSGYIGYNTTQLNSAGASQTSTQHPDSLPQPTPLNDTSGQSVNELYRRYAHMHYANSMLRGRTGSVSGKLRFDIAPGSIIKINPSFENTIGGEDHLAFSLYGCVSRVSITINAEAGVAGTTFNLTHMRTDQENTVPRTSVAEHPLFGNAIHGGGRHGSPLVDGYSFDVPE